MRSISNKIVSIDFYMSPVCFFSCINRAQRLFLTEVKRDNGGARAHLPLHSALLRCSCKVKPTLFFLAFKMAKNWTERASTAKASLTHTQKAHTIFIKKYKIMIFNFFPCSVVSSPRRRGGLVGGGDLQGLDTEDRAYRLALARFFQC